MTVSPHRLWDKGAPLDEAVHAFTVGDDPVWDRHLLEWDCLGSAAHARTLQRAGLLDDAECARLLSGLAEIYEQARRGAFEFPPGLEDCHTAIEAHLRQVCGPAGEKIHAARSRNDQVATAMRLFLRHHALAWFDALAELVAECRARIARDGDVVMPGYTHLQPAMPSSIGLWLHAWCEAGLEQMRAVLDLLGRLDACPLGTGAGYGVPIPLDRAYTAALLGFSRVQRSAVDVQNSRGRLELYFVRVGVDSAALLEKISLDLLLFSTAEFGFFRLPAAMTTGSSLMPQKNNPDVLELLRARSARLRARVVELEQVAGKLPSGYHRDLQLTKEPAIRTALEVAHLIAIASRVIGGFEVCHERLHAALRPELYATHAALARAAAGTPFRTAYGQVAADVAAGRFDDRAAVPWRADAGRVAAADLDEVCSERDALRAAAAGWRERIHTAQARLLPAAVAPPPRSGG